MSDLGREHQTLICESEARSLFDQHLDKLAKCFHTGWQAWENLGTLDPDLQRPLKARTRACFIYDHIVHCAKYTFEGVKGVNVLEEHGFLVLNFEDKIVLRFKKLNAKGRSRNIETNQQRQFKFQMDIPGMPPAATKATAGYILNKLQTEIKELRIACFLGDDQQWLIPIQDAAPDIIPHPAAAEPTTRKRTVRSKRPKKETT